MEATPQKADKTASSKTKSSRAKRHVAAFSGHNANKATLRTEPLEKPSGHISLRAENLGEEIDVNIYKPDGSFDEASLAKLDDLFR